MNLRVAAFAALLVLLGGCQSSRRCAGTRASMPVALLPFDQDTAATVSLAGQLARTACADSRIWLLPSNPADRMRDSMPRAARVLIAGSVVSNGADWRVALRAIDTETSVVLYSIQIPSARLDQEQAKRISRQFIDSVMTRMPAHR